MTLANLKLKVKRYTADEEANMFSDALIISFIDEAIDRIRSNKAFSAMNYLTTDNGVPNILPEPYHYLLSLFAASRCLQNDERFYLATNLMNEFESKFEELLGKVESGEIELVDTTGTAIDVNYTTDYVANTYFVTYPDEDGEW